MSDPHQPSPYGPSQPSADPQQPFAAAPPQQNPYAVAHPYGFGPPPPRMNTLAIASLCASGSIVVGATGGFS